MDKHNLRIDELKDKLRQLYLSPPTEDVLNQIDQIYKELKNLLDPQDYADFRNQLGREFIVAPNAAALAAIISEQEVLSQTFQSRLEKLSQDQQFFIDLLFKRIQVRNLHDKIKQNLANNQAATPILDSVTNTKPEADFRLLLGDIANELINRKEI